MKSSSRVKGFKRELELLHKLWDMGFACIRGPASGSRTKRIFYPDIVAIKNGVILILEVKTTRYKNVYIRKDKLARLVSFLRKASGNKKVAYVFIAVKRVGKTDWKFVPTSELIDIGSRYKIDIERVRSLGLRDLVELTVGHKKLTDYLKEQNNSSSSPR